MNNEGGKSLTSSSKRSRKRRQDRMRKKDCKDKQSLRKSEKPKKRLNAIRNYRP